MNTYTNEREWAVDATPYRDKDKAELKRLGISLKLKEPKETDSRKERFLSFRKKEFRKDKSGQQIRNDPIKIEAADGSKWDGSLIGNESIADVKFNLVNYGPGKPKGIYIQAIRVLKHVPYEVQEFEPLGEDDEFFAGEGEPQAGTKTNFPDHAIEPTEEDLNDEVPF